MIFLLCVFIGATLVVQAEITDGQMVYVSKKTQADYQTMIDSEKKALENIKAQIEETEALLESYREDLSNAETTIVVDNIKDEFDKYRIMAGVVPLKGPGATIVVDDGNRELYEGEDVNNLLVHDIDILMIINELKYCGAEAISVNGQRIVDATSVNCSGWTIRINGRTYARPFVIKAIGDGKKMTSYLLSPQGYGTSLRDWGVIFTIELSDEIEVGAYYEDRRFKYAEGMKGEKEE